jgi:hypothetical protein
MLTGHTPDVDNYQHISEINFQATDAVDVLIKHARERDPDMRFATAAEMRQEISRTRPESTINQNLRVGLAWLSERFKQFTSGIGLTFLLPGLAILLALSLISSVPDIVRLLTRLLMPLLLISLLISIVFNWIVHAIARRHELRSLTTNGRGMGAILGLVIMLNLISVFGPEELSQTPYALSTFFAMMVLAIFMTALAVGIMIAIAWISQQVFKSYTTGFYWSFVAIVIFVLILTILGQPADFISPAREPTPTPTVTPQTEILPTFPHGKQTITVRSILIELDLEMQRATSI